MEALLCQNHIPGRRPIFGFGDIVKWGDERARIHSDPLVYDQDYFYDISLSSTGQLILGVCEDDLEMFAWNAEVSAKTTECQSEVFASNSLD